MTPELHLVSVCVNYGDMLRYTLPTWRSWAEHIVVLTTPGDTETQEVCQQAGVVVSTTESFYHRGHKFDKGHAIADALHWWKKNRGEIFRQPQHWILHLDADVVLPARETVAAQLEQLDPRRIYGALRRMCETWDEYNRVQAEGWSTLRLENPFRRQRFVWGFFQLAQAIRWRTVCPMLYMTNRDASKSDIWTSARWGRANQTLVPGLEVLHLGKAFTNWKGRVTPRFGPEQHGSSDTLAVDSAAAATETNGLAVV
jgi:hypothetical protein